MTPVTLCMIAIIWLLIWCVWLEYRQRKTNQAMLQIIGSFKILSKSSKTQNDQIEAVKLRLDATANALRNHGHDITLIVHAINEISQEENDDVFTKPKPPTMQ